MLAKKCFYETHKFAFSEKSAVFKKSNLIFKIFLKIEKNKMLTILFFLRKDNLLSFLKRVYFLKTIHNFRHHATNI